MPKCGRCGRDIPPPQEWNRTIKTVWVQRDGVVASPLQFMLKGGDEPGGHEVLRAVEKLKGGIWRVIRFEDVKVRPCGCTDSNLECLYTYEPKRALSF